MKVGEIYIYTSNSKEENYPIFFKVVDIKESEYYPIEVLWSDDHDETNFKEEHLREWGMIKATPLALKLKGKDYEISYVNFINDINSTC